MKPLPHEYEVTLTGSPAGYATVASAGLQDVTTAPPPEYDGPGDAWSPEHLLLAAVSACFLFTFRAIAHASHVEFVELEAHTSGTVARSEGVTRFTDIVVRATVTVTAAANPELLQRAIDKTTSRCIVSSSLAVEPRVEVTIHRAGSSGTIAA